MQLNIDNVLPYLLDKKLVDILSVVDRNLTIVDASHRNRNIMILREMGPNYLLKQPFNIQSISGSITEREAYI